jgi:flagellar L-ring protein precursor FlgH
MMMRTAKTRYGMAGSLVLVIVGVLISCATPHGGMTVHTDPVVGNAPAAPPATPSFAPDADDTMSLWSEEVAYGDLFSDPKARRAGDILTIKIVESSSASNSADTSTDRESSLRAGVDEFFGIKPSTFNLQDLSVSGGIESEFEGSGSTTRSGSLEAFITVRVVEVMPNGNMKIVGSREIMVNNEKQIMTIYGVVRPRDVSDDNVVLSTFVADARIAYSGAGIVDDRQRPGWVANALNTIWPF